MPEISIDVEIWCSCGAGLCNQSSTNRKGTGIIVEPCEKCLEKQYDEGKDDGYSEGYSDKEKEISE